jgi:hypothetical protein
MDSVHQKRLHAVVLARFTDTVSGLRAYAALVEPGEARRVLKVLAELEALRHGFEVSGRRSKLGG